MSLILLILSIILNIYLGYRLLDALHKKHLNDKVIIENVKTISELHDQTLNQSKQIILLTTQLENLTE